MVSNTFIYNSSFYTKQVAYYAKNTSTADVKTSFQEQVTDAMGRAQGKTYNNAVEDYKRRHPEYAAMVDSQVRSGKEVLRRNGVEDMDRDSMTMEEYKQFFTELMDSIPYDSSQLRDTNVWSVTDKGWEQMKNDPDYEAWILGYTAQDRSFHDQWAFVPGVEPRFHTEHFGASIEEHLGQSFPISSAGGSEGESWWFIRHQKFQKTVRESEEAYDKKTKESNLDENRKSAPYDFLAKDGMINYKGVTFLCDAEKNRITLGDVSNPNKCLKVSLKDGGTLMVNLDNLEELTKAITMFSPEDQARIMKAITLHKMSNRTQREIEDLEVGISDNSSEEEEEKVEEAKEKKPEEEETKKDAEHLKISN